MNSQQILTAYQEAADLTRLMLAAARAGDWDQVIEHEKACAAIISPLIGENTEALSDAAFRQRKAALIRSMLDDDAHIRALAEPQLARLSQLIGNTRQQSRLHQSYGNLS